MKFIAIDIDGTLTNKNKEVTPYTRRVLIQAQKRGYRLILASGRTTKSLYRYSSQLEMDTYQGLLVSYNGAIVVDCTDHSIVYEASMDVETCRNIIRHLRHFHGVTPIVDYGDYMYVENVFDHTIEYEGHPFNVLQYEARNGNYKLCEVDDLLTFVKQPLPKILTYASPSTYAACFEELKKPFEDTVNCMYTADFYVEFTKKGVDKGSAVRHVLESNGYSDKDVIAFGDAPNDISMLTYASIGIAMKNAGKDVIAVADRIAPSNEEDGVAKVVWEYLER